ncbi:MAG: efflux RND transporter permease subunit, partial [Thiovulaceae bacterium]|nr:efflux RND transporter permease subunit [Sulfurimonadaceae bacterium]
YMHIPKEIFPPAAMDKVQINGIYVGASADVLDKMAVDAIEDKLKGISDIKDMTSSISNGRFNIEANIKTSADNSSVLADVKDIITEIKTNLPADMDEPTARIEVRTIPLIQVAIAGDVPITTLIEAAEDLKEEFSEIEALAKVMIYGDADKELLIKLSDQKISAYGLDYTQVLQAVSNISSIFPVGNIKEQGSHLYISTINGEKDIQKYQNMVIAVGNKKIRLSDIAEVKFALSDVTTVSHFNGKSNISINISKSDEGNAMALVKEIKEILAKKQAQTTTLKFDVYSDTSIYIKNRLNTVVSNIFFGLILVFIALLLSVDRGIAFVVVLGIPMSFIVGLVASDIMGYSLNLLSLLGALLALGMLVDEAIVVAENIYRHLEEGEEPIDAVINGATEMFPAVLTATMTTVFAFLPMLLMSGDMGVFIRILPIMISILLVSSLFEAFYFLPLHAKDFMKVRKSASKSHNFWNKFYGKYQTVLKYLFKSPKRSLAVMVGSIFVAMIVLGGTLKFQLFPEFDVTQINISGKVNINNDLEDTEQLVYDVEKILLEKFDMKNEVEHVTTVIGLRMNAKNQSELGENLFHIFIDLYEKNPENIFDTYLNPLFSPAYDDTRLKRDRMAQEIVVDAKRWLDKLKDKRTKTGQKIFEEFAVVAPQAGVVANDLEIGLSGKGDETLVKGLDTIKKRLADLDAVYNVSDDAKEGELELKLRVNEYGQSLGFSESSVATALRSLYLKAEYAKMFGEDGLMAIKIEGSNRDLVSSLKTFELNVPQTTQKVKLTQICDFIYQKAYAQILKEDGSRMRSIFGSLKKAEITSGEVMAHLKPTLAELKEEGYTLHIKGEARENQRVMGEMMYLAVLSMLLIFITLVWMFDSYAQSLIILSTIPLSLLGVILGHVFMGLDLSMFAMMGTVGLTGVVVNDGLIMIDFIKKSTTREELIKLATMRVRPIFLTSVTTVVGLSTLMFFATGQALIMKPMAVSLGFGVAWATVLNLLYVPLMYVVYEENKQAIKAFLIKYHRFILTPIAVFILFAWAFWFKVIAIALLGFIFKMEITKYSKPYRDKFIQEITPFLESLQAKLKKPDDKEKKHDD